MMALRKTEWQLIFPTLVMEIQNSGMHDYSSVFVPVLEWSFYYSKVLRLWPALLLFLLKCFCCAMGFLCYSGVFLSFPSVSAVIVVFLLFQSASLVTLVLP